MGFFQRLMSEAASFRTILESGVLSYFPVMETYYSRIVMVIDQDSSMFGISYMAKA